MCFFAKPERKTIGSPGKVGKNPKEIKFADDVNSPGSAHSALQCTITYTITYKYNLQFVMAADLVLRSQWDLDRTQSLF